MFTTRQVELLRALVNRIIPPDEYPGGWEGGVGDYLFGQFERDLQPVRDIYRLGLDGLDAEALMVYKRPFDQLDPDQADVVLTNLEFGRVVTPWVVDPVAFFRMVCHHCAEGYYSDPGNGGNRDEAAWKMIGFEVRG